MPMSLSDCENFLEDFENKSLGRADKCLSSYPEVSCMALLTGHFRNLGAWGPTLGDSINQDFRGSSLRMYNKTKQNKLSGLNWSSGKCKLKSR